MDAEPTPLAVARARMTRVRQHEGLVQRLTGERPIYPGARQELVEAWRAEPEGVAAVAHRMAILASKVDKQYPAPPDDDREDHDLVRSVDAVTTRPAMAPPVHPAVGRSDIRHSQ